MLIIAKDTMKYCANYMPQVNIVQINYIINGAVADNLMRFTDLVDALVTWHSAARVTAS